uniref:Uncharacterized protein n=1 Tax=Ananas comosus var. bracteatus TaxID=296719 RepID=A0A6V7PXI1_ANACO|nr:unnamed protein product [Ananas comosus var. bracteatus]
MSLAFILCFRYDDIGLETDDYACLPLCSFAHACEGRFAQAGTPDIAIAIYTHPCEIGRQNGMPWRRLIPRVGMLTTTGPLGTAQAYGGSGHASGGLPLVPRGDISGQMLDEDALDNRVHLLSG